MLLRRHRLWIWAAALWTLVQIPYLSGPFRIDDPYHIEAARQIQRAPTDPYGFQINWDGTPKSAFVTYASPPLVPAWLALWSCIFPQNEVSLHLAMLPFSLIALVTFGLLAKAFGVRSAIAMALLACSPAFFLTSQVLMPDMPMLCLLLLTVTGARSYLRERNTSAAVVAFVAAFCCPLAKYNGAVLVPVLISLGFAAWPGREAASAKDGDDSHDRWDRIRAAFPPGLVAIITAPMLSLACWGGYSWVKYGAVHFLKMSAFQRGQPHSLDPATLTVGILGALGLGVVPLALLGFLFRSTVSVGLAGIAVCSGIGAASLAALAHYGFHSVLMLAFSVFVSVYVLGLLVRLAWRCAAEDRDLVPLAVWVLAGLAFQYGLMFSAVRYVLYLAPPIIILVLRLSSWVPRQGRLTAVLGGNLFFVFALGFADSWQANVYPAVVADEIRPRLEKSGGRFFFDGHWGLQYYATQIGGEPVDELHPPSLRVGDLVLVAKMAWPKLTRPPQAPGLDIVTTTLTHVSFGPLRTMSCGAAANFYSSVMSDCPLPTWLPFGFSWEPAESFVLYSVQKIPAATTPLSSTGTR